MPIYEYQAVEAEKSCEHCQQPFEVFQPLSEDALQNCKYCNAPIRRVIAAVGFKMGKKYLLTDKNIKKKGFTKLVNEGDGKYRKI